MINFTFRDRLPVIPMRTQVILPSTRAAFDIGRGVSLVAAQQAEARYEAYVFIVRQTLPKEDASAEDLCKVGTIARIRQRTRMPGGDRVRVIVEGIVRARVVSYETEEGCIMANLEEMPTIHGDPETEEAGFRVARELVGGILGRGGLDFKEMESALAGIADAEQYIDICTHFLHIHDPVKQEILEEQALDARLTKFTVLLNRELEVVRIEQQIMQAVRKNIDRSQREYFLREQLKVIHEELGDGVEEGEKIKERIEQAGLPEAIKEKALSELSRMDRITPSSPEYTVIRNYLDWILDLPWSNETQDTASLQDVEHALAEDHYGLETIKERVLEYLAVLKLTGELKAPILCLVGPPGVGKTSIARSIARALGRKFVRMSLGGLKDEAEIRGHRRTYVGAMPGRIIYEMKNAGSVNPVFLLDEVDKISSDLRGDPASALLEVLDPEQNNAFRDRYIEEPYDLSKVMFIATANTLDTIPMPLLDRMEVIELSGYTPEEKLEIAKRFLIPKQSKLNGLKAGQLRVSDDAVMTMIEGFTMESGVRSLERTIGAVCRKAAVCIAKGEKKGVRVTAKNLETYIGARRYLKDDGMRERDEVGAATGLAWTAVGGATLTIEVSAMQGKGEVILTGKLGDVMKESAQAAISYIRAHAEKYGIDRADFANKDIHIHVPAGATPKDGPSAGITMATAILSAFTGLPVRRDIAMTGEITLRGKVLPIGGLKEKALAASRIGIREIVIPEENRKDIEEIPENIRKDLEFICVSGVDEVFARAVRGLHAHR